jgi:hypothetical protein
MPPNRLHVNRVHVTGTLTPGDRDAMFALAEVRQTSFSLELRQAVRAYLAFNGAQLLAERQEANGDT